MKKALIFFIALIFIHSFTFPQAPWTYVEQVSGVTTNLTSASTNPSFGYQSFAMICGTGGVVIKTTNYGTNWVNISGGGLPANINLITICCFATDTVVTAGNIGAVTYVYRTVNGGINWTQVFSQTNGAINAIVLKNSQLGYLVGNPVGGRWSLWKTTNKGLTWDSTGMYIPQSAGETGLPNSMSARHNYVLFGTNNSRIYRSTNNGLNWSFFSTPEVTSNSLWVNSDTSGFAFIFSGGLKLFRTTNLGNNWAQSICPDSTSNFVGFCPGIPGVADNSPYYVFAAKNNNKIYFSGYGGTTFTSSYTSPAGIYNYLSYDYSQYLSPGYSYAVRSNGGITRVDYFLGGGIRQLSVIIPAEYELKQNYPNPFNPATYIRFAVKKYGVVKLIVFDVTGREIYVPVNEFLRPGVYEVSWDASSISSGIYFYRLMAEGFTETKKMITVK